MVTSKKSTRQKLAPAVRETGVLKQTDALLTNPHGLHEHIGEKVQPLVALMYSARTPAIGWRSRSLSSKANEILSSARREFSSLRGQAHG